AFMSARVNTTNQPGTLCTIQAQSKVNVGTATIDGVQTNGLGGPNTSLVPANWYKLTATFTNIKASVANSYTITSTLQDMGADGLTPGSILMTLGGSVTNANADIANDSSVFAAFRGF